MKESGFVRRIRKLARKRSVTVDFIPARSKGSHGTLYFGGQFTVVRDLKDELRTVTFHAMLQKLAPDA